MGIAPEPVQIPEPVHVKDNFVYQLNDKGINYFNFAVQGANGKDGASPIECEHLAQRFVSTMNCPLTKERKYARHYLTKGGAKSARKMMSGLEDMLVVFDDTTEYFYLAKTIASERWYLQKV